jgi:hypothetical protein
MTAAISSRPPIAATDPRTGKEYKACNQPTEGGSFCLRYTGHTSGSHRPTLAKPISESRVKYLAMTPEEQEAAKAKRVERQAASKAKPKKASVRKPSSKPPTEKQIAARERFAEAARARHAASVAKQRAVTA